MKRIAVAALLLLMLVFAGTLSATNTKASAVAKPYYCVSTNAPKAGTPGEPYDLVGCEIDATTDLPCEIYQSRPSPWLYIHRPVN
jgi:hypothetical protein